MPAARKGSPGLLALWPAGWVFFLDNHLTAYRYMATIVPMEYTSQQAAAKLGVSPARIRQLCIRGEVKYRLLTPRLALIDGKSLAGLKRRKAGRPRKSDKGR